MTIKEKQEASAKGAEGQVDPPGQKRRCVHLTLLEHDLEHDPVPMGEEPVYRDGRFVGYTRNPQFSPYLNAYVCTAYIHDYLDFPAPSLPEWTQPNTVLQRVTPVDPMRLLCRPLQPDFLSKRATFQIDIGSRLFRCAASLYAPKFRPVEIVPMPTSQPSFSTNI